MDNDAEIWLEFVKTDLGVAKHLNSQYYPKPFEIVCYHCQQAAEKAIKSIMIACNAQSDIPRKHNLSFLLDQIESKIDIPEKYYDYCDMLTPYGIAVRYPNGILFLEESHVQDAIYYAEEIVEWAEKIILEKI